MHKIKLSMCDDRRNYDTSPSQYYNMADAGTSTHAVENAEVLCFLDPMTQKM